MFQKFEAKDPAKQATTLLCSTYQMVDVRVSDLDAISGDAVSHQAARQVARAIVHIMRSTIV